jgi:hypothetical protein
MQAMNTKCNETPDLCEWIAEVKALDDEKQFECQQNIKAFKLSAAATCAASCTITFAKHFPEHCFDWTFL